MSEKKSIRIGMVNFINTAPLYETWKSSVHRADWQVVEAPPLELNRKLSAGELDLGFISSHEYAAAPHKYAILKDLSISANGPVGSVYLFSEIDLADLDGKQVFLSPQSQTSNSLVKIILEKFIKVKPEYLFSNSLEAPALHCQTVVAIGDRALRIKASGRYPVVVDLSEIWHEYTKLPFVFAVWAVRQDFYEQHPEIVFDVHKELLRCIDDGKRDLLSVCEIAAPRIPIAVTDCFEYLKGIEYDLDATKIESLKLFFNYLIERGEGDTNALPVRFIN